MSTQGRIIEWQAADWLEKLARTNRKLIPIDGRRPEQSATTPQETLKDNIVFGATVGLLLPLLGIATVVIVRLLFQVAMNWLFRQFPPWMPH